MNDTDTLLRRIAELEARADEFEEGKRQLDHVLEVARIGTWELDLVTRVAEWSPETRRILGVGAEAPATPETVKAATDPADRQIVDEALRRVVAGSRRYDITYRVNWPDGSQRIIHSRGNVIPGPDGRASRIAGVVQDVTEQEGLRVQLLHAQKLETVGRLAAGVAHDLNNMLTVIQGSCVFVADEVRSEEAQADVRTIMEATERAAALTRGLLAFGRQQVLRPVVTDLNQLVGDLRKMLSRLLGDAITIELRLLEGLGHALVDPHQLVQVVVNLALNARHAMPRGGTLTLRTSQARLPPDLGAPQSDLPYLCVAVQDTGTGMDRATMARIFEPFFTTRGAHGGTGLGLSSAFGIVAQSGGHLRVTSSPGQGSTFEIFLPLTEAAPALTSQPAAAAPARQGTGTVLVAEDDASVRRMAVRALTLAGCRVLEAENGQEALEHFAAAPHVDLLLTDVLMPGLSGRALADELIGRAPRLRVLFMSGYAGDNPVELRTDDAFLAKPFTPEQLAHRVLELLAGAPAR